MQNNLALVFPGQGSQIVGMGKDFFSNFRESQLVFEEASDAVSVNLKKLCFDGPLDELTLTENLQPALFTVEAAILTAIRAHAEVPACVTAGHSLGEYAALYACGALSLTAGAKLTRVRGGAMQRAVPLGKGTMAAVLGMDAPRVQTLCRLAREKAPGEVVEPANFNAPGQVVIAGSVDGVAAAVALLKEDLQFKGGKAIPLQVSAPFHCSLMEPAQKEMEPHLDSTSFSKPKFAILPNATAEATTDATQFASLLSRQIVHPVLWEQSMGKLRALGAEQVIEIGPGKVLSGLQKRIDREMPIRNIFSVESLREVFP